jgi:hypothetical protein
VLEQGPAESAEPGEAAAEDEEPVPYALAASSLVAAYRLDGDADDSSGNGRHATASGAVPAADAWGDPAGAYALDGVDDHLVLPDETAFDLSQFTIALWFNHSGITQSATLVMKGPYAGHNYWLSLIRVGGATYPNVHFGVYNADGSFTSIANWENYYAPGAWHHVAATYDGATLALYVDGVLKVTAPDTIGLQLNDAPVHVGRREDGYQAYPGLIDDVRFYSRALTLAEIQNLMRGQVAAYNFDQNTLDLSGNGNEATRIGAKYGPDEYGNPKGALQFDGINDYVRLPYEAQFDLRRFTIAAHVRPQSGSARAGFGCAWASLISKGPYAGAFNLGLERCRSETSGVLSYVHKTSATTHAGAQAAAVPISMDGSWHRVAVTSDGAETLLYVDGTLAHTETLSGLPVLNNASVVVGKPSAFNLSWFQGALDNLQIYQRPLSAAEVSAL